MWQVEGQKWDEGIAGAAEMGEETPPGVPPNWMAYFAVADADDAVKMTSDGGGQVLVPVTPTPVGRLAVFTDPQGAALGVIEPDYPEPR